MGGVAPIDDAGWPVPMARSTSTVRIGAASAAADCFKALVPFFLFAAIKNRMWSQAAAAAVVWVVVTAYSLTSALGHAALNRLDTAGTRIPGRLPTIGSLIERP